MWNIIADFKRTIKGSDIVRRQLLLRMAVFFLPEMKKKTITTSIGGAVHMGETAEDAVKREVFEETGVEYEVDRLAVIHENFFNESSGSLQGTDCHEIALYYLMNPRGSQILNSNSYTLGVKENMYWIPIERLEDYKAYPLFMKEFLQTGHCGIEHIITDERA